MCLFLWKRTNFANNNGQKLCVCVWIWSDPRCILAEEESAEIWKVVFRNEKMKNKNARGESIRLNLCLITIFSGFPVFFWYYAMIAIHPFRGYLLTDRFYISLINNFMFFAMWNRSLLIFFLFITVSNVVSQLFLLF